MEIRDKPHIVVLDDFADGSEAEKTLAGCWRWMGVAAAQIRKLIIVSNLEGATKNSVKAPQFPRSILNLTSIERCATIFWERAEGETSWETCVYYVKNSNMGTVLDSSNGSENRCD